MTNIEVVLSIAAVGGLIWYISRSTKTQRSMGATESLRYRQRFDAYMAKFPNAWFMQADEFARSNETL